MSTSPWTLLFGVNGGTKTVFFRQLSAMVNAGLPVGRAVTTSSQAGLTSLGQSMTELIESKGLSLSEAMARFPYHFTKHDVALVKAGEKSGQLDRQLEELAKTAEAHWRMQKKVTSKLVYPAIVAHCVVLLPPLFLLVKDGIEAYLKATLGILIPAYIVIGTLLLCYRYFRHTGGPRRVMDQILSSLPLLGGPAKYGARIRFLRALANLTEAGFLPSQAVPLAADSCDNYWLRDRVLRAWQKLGKEVPISDIMRASGGFESFELGLVLSGEEAGSFSRALLKASESMQPEYEAQIHRLMTVMPILLLFIVGGMVGFMAIKTMSGIFAPVADLL